MCMKKLLCIALCSAAVWCVRADDGITCERFPDADAVVVDERESVAYNPDGTYESQSESWTKVLTERGQREERVITLGYNARYGKAEILSLGVIDTNGVERTVDFAATMKEATDNSSMTDNIFDPLDRKITCTVPGLEIGETVHLRTRRSVVKSRIQDQWSDLSVMEWTYPILRSVYEVKAPAARPIRSKAIRHPLGNVVEEVRTLADGSTLHTYTATNSPRMFPEPDMPPAWTQVQNVRLSTAADWREISQWYWNLCAPRLARTTVAMTNKVNEIGRDIRALFKFVSQEVRYMGLTMEDDSPGYAPHDVDITFDNRYGVCRDKAGLLVAMLRIAGFKAFPVLINVGAKMDPDVPQPYFNHAIVAVEEDRPGADGERSYILMDPTNENTKDIFPAYLCARSYLVARPDGEGLRTSPVPPPERNAAHVVSSGKLAKDGSIVLESAIDFLGVYDTAYRGSLVRRTPELRTAFFERVVQSAATGAELLKCEIEPNDLRDTEKPLKVRLLARFPAMVLRGRTEDGLRVPMVSGSIDLIGRLLADNALLEKREYPLVLSSTAQTAESLTLNLGEALGDVKELPADLDITGAFGCRRTMALTNGVLTVNRVASLNAVELAPKDYLDLRERMKEVEAAARKRPIFHADAVKGADVLSLLDSSAVHIASDTEWVITNETAKQILTYQGKKRSAELKFSYNPTWKKVEVLSATVSNRNGRVYAVKPGEMNVMDCGWASAAPRYPASKMLVVNLPSVEIGSVISVKTAVTVTNAPAPFYGIYYFDSYQPTDRRIVSVNGWRREVENPPRLPDEPMQPDGELWRDCVVISSNSFKRAAWSLRAAVEVEPVRGGGDLPDFASMSIVEIRKWLHTNVRIAGPSLYEVPLDLQVSSPETVLRERYATRLDYVRTLCAILRGAGHAADIVFAASNADEPEAIRRRDKFGKPNVRAFSSALCRVSERIGGETRITFVGTESEYAPLGMTGYAGADYFDPVDCAFGLVEASLPDYLPRTVEEETFLVRENGSVDIDVRARVWGPEVAGLRRKYAEILPKDRERNHQSILGRIAKAATATSEFETDVKGYPFETKFSCFVPDFATVEGDTITLTLGAFDRAGFPLTGAVRETPLGIAAKDAYESTARVVFPEGYATIEHLPKSFAFRSPADVAVWCEGRVSSAINPDGRLEVVVHREMSRRIESLLDASYFPLLKDWTRICFSPETRTISVRRKD